MTIDDLSTYLSVPVATLYAWRRRREGPKASKVGKHLRWRRADVDAWLDARADVEPVA
jgi:excisionase family DNA binding protein